MDPDKVLGLFGIDPDKYRQWTGNTIRVHSYESCCGTTVKLYKEGRWVCSVCEKPDTSPYYSGGTQMLAKKCECGSAVCGLNHHSHWCPLYVIP